MPKQFVILFKQKLFSRRKLPNKIFKAFTNSISSNFGQLNPLGNVK